jgi:hypothetical protein
MSRSAAGPSLVAVASLGLIAAAPAPSAGPCFTVHGRLAVWNGAPAIRIAVSGSHRILGVHNPEGTADGPGLVPPQVRALIGADGSGRVSGDYRVCPLAPDLPGRMRPVWIQNAHGLRADG